MDGNSDIFNTCTWLKLSYINMTSWYKQDKIAYKIKCKICTKRTELIITHVCSRPETALYAIINVWSRKMSNTRLINIKISKV